MIVGVVGAGAAALVVDIGVVVMEISLGVERNKTVKTNGRAKSSANRYRIENADERDQCGCRKAAAERRSLSERLATKLAPGRALSTGQCPSHRAARSTLQIGR
jgi:hypothetical protein